MQETTIAQAWQSYESEVIPKDAPPVQIIESRRAFYAGARAAFALFTSIDETISDEAGVAIIEGVSTELKDFAAKVMSGQA